MKQIITFLSIFLTLGAFGQSPANNTKFLIWTGEADKDFFNEKNWREATADNLIQFQNFSAPSLKKISSRKAINAQVLQHNQVPEEGSIDPATKIYYNLYLKDADINVEKEVLLDENVGAIVMHASSIKLKANIKNVRFVLDYSSTITMEDSRFFSEGTTIQLKDADSWVRFENQIQEEVGSLVNKGIISNVDQSKAAKPRIRPYYNWGTIVDMGSILNTPLTVYSERGLKGTSTDISVRTIFKGSAIPNGFNNKIRSFVLKRGYMVTFAAKDNGTGKSKVYIASEKDLVVNDLPVSLQGTISFVRVLPWSWVTKKGTGGLITGLDAGWFYDWGFRRGSQPNYEYVPMTWGHTSTSAANIGIIANKDTVTHILGFNESDNCSDQSGQFGNLCQPAVAVDYAQYLMHTGFRIGSPAPRENGPTTWLREFNTIAKERDVRFDFVAVHWYDWGANTPNTSTSSADAIFNRFKTYLANVYALYQLPIWITEFNANPKRDSNIQAEFLKLALPYLETLPYVERYAYFQPNPQGTATVGTGNYYLDNNLTTIGTIYKNHVSTPSIPDSTLECLSNLEGMDKEILEVAGVDYEAEHAKLQGTPGNVVCERSSNGRMISVGAPITNALVYDSIMAPSEGSYRMTISYMAAVARKIRLTVNGTEVGILNMPRSGEWCFNNGIPVDFKVSVNLKSGRNTVEFRATGTDAPFIDKINLARESTTFEAEKATLVGDVAIINCTNASNKSAVDLKTSPVNAAKFNVTVANAGLYFLDVAYVAKAQLVGAIIVNDRLVKNEFFEISGDLCDEGGVPRVTSIEIALKQGNNTIEVRPLGIDAPNIDKISLVSNDQMLTSVEESLLADENNFVLYPNPAAQSDQIAVLVQSDDFNAYDLQIYDILGNEVISRSGLQTNQVVRLETELPQGVFIAVITDGLRRLSKRIVVR